MDMAPAGHGTVRAGGKSLNVRNIFADLPTDSDAEVFEPLLEHDGMTLERIVSTGQATPPGEWLQQDRQEWVVLVSGRAALRFEGEQGERLLQPGDYVLIPARCRHRVEWTDANQSTVWLALHYH
jgi:cupin 2 domain-containing protein